MSLTAVSETFKYCYMESNCLGAKPEKAQSVVSKDECCSHYGGYGWGISDGSDCQPCSEPAQVDSYETFSPDKAAGSI